MRGKPRAMIKRVQFARIHRPYTVVLAVVMPVPGVLGLIYGNRVSAALSILGSGIISRAIGAAFLVGSILTLVGIARGKSLFEAYGLTIMAAGCLIYGFGVMLGLGLGGMIAGPGFIAIAVGTVLRVISLAAAAHEVVVGDERDVNGRNTKT